jgi:hypothetical protein
MLNNSINQQLASRDKHVSTPPQYLLIHPPDVKEELAAGRRASAAADAGDG